MLCESVNTDQEEKEGDVLKGNHIINLKNLTAALECLAGYHRPQMTPLLG